ncbi:hypothetical protein EDD11_001224 [Mortierella claussenii]|nr:hypothetical protein EDD11_001224 [Mortierella claussenii]
MEETAVNLAHRYANAAEEYQERGQWAEAVGMHNKAADQFLLATRDTQNQEVIQALKLMNANHMRQAKDLQRKVAKAAAATAAAEAALAAAASQPHQRATSMRTKSESGTAYSRSATSSKGSTTATVGSPATAGGGGSGADAGWAAGVVRSSADPVTGRRRGNSEQQQGNSGGLGQRHLNPPFPQILGQQITPRGEAGLGAAEGEGSYVGSTSESSSNSSSAMIEESFTLIKNHAYLVNIMADGIVSLALHAAKQKDESDPFNKFWDAVENLVLKISSPVAFTTIPLDGDDPLAALNSPTTDDPPPLSSVDTPFALSGVAGQGTGDSSNEKAPTTSDSQRVTRTSRNRLDPSSMQESFFIIDAPPMANSQLRNHLRNRSASASDSKPSSSSIKRSETAPRTSSKTLEEYAIENQQLKMALDKLSKRNHKLEKNVEGLMQMSVWTKDVQRSAMQLIKSQDILRPVKQSIHDLSAEKGGQLSQRAQAAVAAANAIAAVSSHPSTLGSSQTTTAPNPGTIHARLQELETEVIQLKLENSKLNTSMKKYKQRWEDLKESAKKRRNAATTPQDGIIDAVTEDSNGSSNSHGRVLNADGRPISQRPLLQTGSNPYSSSSLAGSPNPIGTGGSSNNSNSNASSRPLSALARSSSASGPVLSPGGSYQRRILMENKSGYLDPATLNMHQRPSPISSVSAGNVSASTPPRVLDSLSPRTNVAALAAVPEGHNLKPVASMPPPSISAETSASRSPSLSSLVSHNPSPAAVSPTPSSSPSRSDSSTGETLRPVQQRSP